MGAMVAASVSGDRRPVAMTVTFTARLGDHVVSE